MQPGCHRHARGTLWQYQERQQSYTSSPPSREESLCFLLPTHPMFHATRVRSGTLSSGCCSYSSALLENQPPQPRERTCCWKNFLHGGWFRCRLVYSCSTMPHRSRPRRLRLYPAGPANVSPAPAP
eukprot:scaffold74076_cov36-Phaeocystis_antarctica.AAC.1